MTRGPVEFVVPAGIDDPARPSGGNRYDRRVIDGLTAAGHPVREHAVTDLGTVLDGLPDDAVVVVDGLLGWADPEPVVHASERLRVVVLLHMPFAEAVPEGAARASERALLDAAAVVVTTSDWARDWVVRHHAIGQDRVRVARPGVDRVGDGSRDGRGATSSTIGRNLLCLAAVTRDKGHDVLLEALTRLADLDWSCTCAGALDLEPDLVAELRQEARSAGIGDRVTFTGPLADAALEDALAGADLLVSASRRESYGMAATEALALGVPVVVTDVGGQAEAVGRTSAGEVPGLMVPADDAAALADALRRWLTDQGLRDRLRAAAAERRTTLRPWSATVEDFAVVLAEVNQAGPGSVSTPTAPVPR